MSVIGGRFDEIDYKRLGERIRECRQDRGYSQEELAERINSSKNHLSYVETAKRSVSLVMLVRISNALEISIEDLLSDSLEVVNSETAIKSDSIIGDCSAGKASLLADFNTILSEHGII